MLPRPPRPPLFPYTTLFRSVAAIGLGVGTLASYVQPGQRWTFFEIDPAIERIARDERYFTFLRSCRSEEHTSELQSQSNLVCRLLLEKKNRKSSAARTGPSS